MLRHVIAMRINGVKGKEQTKRPNNLKKLYFQRVNYSPVGKFVWNFASRGLTSVGQDEIVILLEVEEEETLPPRDIFTLIQSIYEQVVHGSGRRKKLPGSVGSGSGSTTLSHNLYLLS
jgi:hypothetical protein